MNRIDQYFVIKDIVLDDLVKHVCKMLKEGWQPFGQFSFDENYYYQAMVKYIPLLQNENFAKIFNIPCKIAS